MTTTFTVATVTRNDGPRLRVTLDSVEEQDYPGEVEHLVVDGASSDDTSDMLRRRQEAYAGTFAKGGGHVLRWISEPDKGLYDAMNKALQRAKGTYVVFLNAGDRLHARDTLATVARAAEEAVREEGRLPGVLYGDTRLVDAEGGHPRPRRLAPPRDSSLHWKSFREGMLVCHQSFYALSSLAREVPYDLSYLYSADFDWCVRMLREAERRGLGVKDTRAVLTDYQAGEGLTERHHLASLRERYRIMAKHYGQLPTLARHLKFAARAINRKLSCGTPNT